MLPDKIEHCIVFMNYWDVSGVFWSFSKCNIKIPHLPADPSNCIRVRSPAPLRPYSVLLRVVELHIIRLMHMVVTFRKVKR